VRSLAHRFYDLVCLKLGQYHTNAQRAKRKSKPPVDAEDPIEVEEDKSFGQDLRNDESVHQNVTEYEHNEFVDDSTSGTNNVQSEDTIPLPISTQSIIAPPGPSLDDRSPMGNTQTMLAEAEPKSRNIKLQQYMMEQRARTNLMDSHHLNSNSAGVESRPSEPRVASPSAYETSQSPLQDMGQNERSLTPTTQNVKRPLSDGRSGRKSKRNKNYPDVQTVKPTLVVALKLTREKGVPDQPTTMPPQQSYVPMPSVEADEISVRHLSVSASRYDAFASDREIGDERASVQHVVPNQDPTNDISEAVMDATYDLNDTDSDYEPTDRIIPVGDTVRPSSATPRQTHVSQKQWDSQAMAEFRKVWADEADEIVNEILTAPFREHTPKKLVRDILLPALEQIRDQLPSVTAQSGSLSAPNDLHEQVTAVTAQALHPDQQQRMVLQQNIEPCDAVSQARPTAETSPPNDAGKTHITPSEPVSENCNTPVQPISSQSCSAVATGSLEVACEADKDDLHSDEQLFKTTPALTSHKATAEESSASEVTKEADQTPPFDFKRLVRNIDLTILLDRNDGLEPKEIGTIDIENTLDSHDFFKAVEYEYGWGVDPDEEFFAAKITEADGPARKRLRTELWLRNASRRDRSWYRWLSELRACYERERVDINMNLIARVLVTKKNDAKG
jgi:hypothetical protein